MTAQCARASGGSATSFGKRIATLLGPGRDRRGSREAGEPGFDGGRLCSGADAVGIPQHQRSGSIAIHDRQGRPERNNAGDAWQSLTNGHG